MTITAGDVRRWMEDAGGTVMDEGACIAVADVMNDRAQMRAYIEKVENDNAHVGKAFRRAHDAVNELRAVLPLIVRRYADQARSAHPLAGKEWAAECWAMQTRCEEMLAALVDIPKQPTTSPLHGREGKDTLFAFLFIAAGHITGKSPTTNETGFAVQFVQRAHAAFEKLPVGMTAGAVAKAIQRTEDTRAALAAAVSRARRRDEAP